MPHTSTLIIGAGQAGLAVSWHLTAAGHDHVVLERGRVGERWRSERWASLALLTPNWANDLPGMPGPMPSGGFQTAAGFVTGLEHYARSFGAPVRGGTTVLSLERSAGGFRVETDRDTWHAETAVLAAGDAAAPTLPACADAAPAGIDVLHVNRYRDPTALRPGAVLVVGAGPSAHQVAYELAGEGRPVVMAVGRHARVPRRYRGRDLWWWLRELGEHDRTDRDPARRTPNVPLDGRDGGRTLDLAVLSRAGVRLTGRLEGFAGEHALFGDQLRHTVAEADARLWRLLDRIDAHVAAGPHAAAFPPAERPAPVRLPAPPRALDLRGEGITTILWATGFRPHLPWLRVPGVVGADGRVANDRGRTPVPGLFVVGARGQSHARSHMIGGVGVDAAAVAGELTRSQATLLAA